MRSVTSDQNAVSLTWASTSTTSQSFSFSFVGAALRSEEHTSELQSLTNLVCRLLLEKKKTSKRQLRKRHTRCTKPTPNTSPPATIKPPTRTVQRQAKSTPLATLRDSGCHPPTIRDTP